MRVGGRSKETPDEREARSWRTVATDYPVIANAYPPNVMPEEILTDHRDRLRAVIVSTANPLRSYADTSAYEEACKKLDLLVTVELSMTETAVLSHYVLPARSGYESWPFFYEDGCQKRSVDQIIGHYFYSFYRLFYSLTFIKRFRKY